MDNLPSRNPEHAIGWPRTVQTGLSILGASAVGIACFFGGGDLVMVGGGAPATTSPTPDPSVTVLFQCDWDDVGNGAEVQSCGTGSAYSWAIRTTTNDTAVQVVDATDNGLSANWPNDRAYLVRCQDRGGVGCARQVVRMDSAFALPVAGDTLAYRFARTVSSDVMKGTGDMDEHGFKFTTTGGLSNTQASVNMQLDVSAGTWETFARALTGIGYPNDKWCPLVAGETGGCNGSGTQAAFADDHGYEFHIMYSFPSDTSFIIEEIRMYDIPGDSLLTDLSWQNINGSDTLPSPENVADTSTVRGWQWSSVTLGHSGSTQEFSFTGTGEKLFYFGGFAVCKQNWCPRYGGLAGEN